LRYHPPIQVSEHRLIRSVVGLRPYRPSGFRVEPDKLDEKLVIHNYGHGGSGVTLCWGTARLALERALAQPVRRVAVLGCGAVGLATARLLQDHGFEVTIYARDLPPHTTSNVAGAFWMPYGIGVWEKRTPPFTEALAFASRFSYRHFETLVGEHYGVRWLSLYLLDDPREELQWVWELTPELCRTDRLDRGEHPFPRSEVWHVRSLLIEPDVYLGAVLQDFRDGGGELVLRELRDRADVMELEEGIVVNCTGLGARTLFGDDEMIPVRGQLAFLEPQPEIDYAYIAGDLYMMPRKDGVLLGGTYEVGKDSIEPDAATTARILEGHRGIAGAMSLAR
jgi:D-amino-acid oxidase